MREKLQVSDASLFVGAARVMLDDSGLRQAYAIAIGCMIVMTALGQFSGKLGPGVLWGWITGK